MARGTWMPLVHGETCRDILLRLAVVLVPLLVVLTVLATLGWLGLAGLARVGWLGTRLLHRMRWAVRHVSSPLLACSVPQGVIPGHPRLGWPFLWSLSLVPPPLRRKEAHDAAILETRCPAVDQSRSHRPCRGYSAGGATCAAREDGHA